MYDYYLIPDYFYHSTQFYPPSATNINMYLSFIFLCSGLFILFDCLDNSAIAKTEAQNFV